MLDVEIPGAEEEEAVWSVQNFSERYHGPVTLRYALMRSINVPAAKLMAAISPRPVIRLVHRLGVARLLNGARGRPPADKDALCHAIVQLSRLAWDLRDVVAEIDVNPVIVTPERAVAVDALVVPKSAASKTSA